MTLQAFCVNAVINFVLYISEKFDCFYSVFKISLSIMGILLRE